MIETLARCFRPLPSTLRRRWGAVGAVNAAAALTELGAAVALYAFLGGADRPEWLDGLLRVPGRDPLFAGVVVVVGILIVKGLLGALATWMRARVTADSIQFAFDMLVRSDLQKDVFLHADASTSSRLIWRAMQVSDSAYRIVASSGVSLFAECVAVAALAAAMIIVAPLPAVVATAAVGAVGAALLLATRNVTLRVGGESHVRSGDLATAMHSVFAVHREIRSKRREKTFTQMLSEIHRRRLPAFRTHLVLLMLPRHVVEICFVLILLLVVLVTRFGLPRQEFIAVLGVFAYSGFRLVPAANRILFSVDEIRHQETAVRELESVSPAEAPDNPSGTPTLDTIHARALGHRYSGSSGPALSGVELTVRPGERIGLIGESGSGKSTLLDLLGGLLRPTSGSVSIGDLPAHEWLRKGGRLGYAPQNSLLLDATIRENIDFGSTRSEEELALAIDTVSLRSTIDRLPDGLETAAGERGGRLSGGERQRVAIARAIVDHPDLLLLDEATSALDQPTEARVLEALAAQRGMTMIVATHRPRSLAFCDRILVMQGGRLVAEGTEAELLASSPEFRRLNLAQDEKDAPPSSATGGREASP